jgi:hypothetical protein
MAHKTKDAPPPTTAPPTQDLQPALFDETDQFGQRRRFDKVNVPKIKASDKRLADYRAVLRQQKISGQKPNRSEAARKVMGKEFPKGSPEYENGCRTLAKKK